MVRALACDSRGRRFDSRLFHCQVATFGKLFTHMWLCHQAVWICASRRAEMFLVGKVTVGLVSHWPRVTDFSGLSTYGLKTEVREMSTLPPLPLEYGTFNLYLWPVSCLFVLPEILKWTRQWAAPDVSDLSTFRPDVMRPETLVSDWVH